MWCVHCKHSHCIFCCIYRANQGYKPGLGMGGGCLEKFEIWTHFFGIIREESSIRNFSILPFKFSFKLVIIHIFFRMFDHQKTSYSKNFCQISLKPTLISGLILNNNIFVCSAIKFSLYWEGLKGVFAKNERGYRLNAIKKRFGSLLILLLSFASIRRKLLKTSHTE